MVVFVGLIIVFLILKWLWNSSFMYEMHILEHREHPFWANVNGDSEGT